MIKKTLILLTYLIPLIVFAQQDTTISDKKEIYIIEEMPEYPGGSMAMMKFIQRKINYPQDAENQNIEGKVYLSFLVNKLGNVEDVNILRSVHPLLDNEAIRVVMSMPKWKPGTQKGVPVSVRYNLPIIFLLE